MQSITRYPCYIPEADTDDVVVVVALEVVIEAAVEVVADVGEVETPIEVANGLAKTHM